MAKFASEKHKAENERLLKENESLTAEVTQLRRFANLVAKFMSAESREEMHLAQLQIINDLEKSGYLPKG